MRTGARKWMPPEYTATALSDDHAAAHAKAASSIQPITVPPCAAPPKFTALGGARNRICDRGAAVSSVYTWPSMAFLMVSRAAIRDVAIAPSARSASVRGVHSGTGAGRRSSSTATKTSMQVVAGSYRRERMSAASPVTATCTLDRPVCTTLACTATSGPGAIGRVCWTFPTYAVTQYRPLQPTAQA